MALILSGASKDTLEAFKVHGACIIPLGGDRVKITFKKSPQLPNEICIGISHNCRCPNCAHIRGDY